MPVSFSKLRISGFKSFAEPTGVDILPGLTGIVGPNGCGKSNIVEALRWAMGESSARGLRGGEMDDVIFAGTSGRPSRNLAEVVVTLHDTQGLAPPPFQEHAELEIQRRIERGSGSNYRINGKEARARDVQTLFADLASGARASAMVSQGRVGALVAARPEERRAILEEAAGITGLHARRHEAELKLRAAETNLARAEDTRVQLDAQLGSLKRQARQANRYRNLSGAIRAAEAELLSIARARAEQDRAAADLALRQAADEAVEAARLVETARDLAVRAADALPPLRETEAAARTELERHRIEREHLAAEERRAVAALDEGRRRLAQLRTDLRHAEQVQADAVAAEARLSSEDGELAAAELAYPDAAREAEAAVVAAADQARAAESGANRAVDAAADANAKVQAATRAVAEAEQKVRRLTEQLARIREERAAFVARLVDPALLQRAVAEEAAAEARLAEARTEVERTEQGHAATARAMAEAREQRAAADAALAKFLAEARALREVLAVDDDDRWPPMLDAVTAPPGLETALGAVLGEELTSALDPEADRHWRELPPLSSPSALPDDAVPLADLIEAPPVLGRALSRIGLVEDSPRALASQADLAPGQILVSRAGAVWRWDGYTIRAGVPTPAAIRLRQRNRLSELTNSLAVAEADAASARTRQTEAENAARTATADEQEARGRRRDAERQLEQARAALTTLRGQAATTAARLAAADEQLTRLEEDQRAAVAVLDEARATNAALPDIAGLRLTVEQARATLTEARARHTAALSVRDTLAREHATRATRRQAIAAERARWATRAADAQARLTELTERVTTAEAEIVALEAAPPAVASRRTEAVETLRLAETSHQRAERALAEASAAAAEADRAARATEATAATRRETELRAEANARQAAHVWGTVAERILERLGANPTLPDPPADLTPEIETKARAKFDRLTKERDEMGPVNLRAETEAAAIEQQIATIDREREELSTAIARLRGSIGNINREGRERLSQVFQAVDRHFQQLFSRMFGGGRAHLALVGSDDPLLAGLEIYAQPPGKKLAALTLLSGGEQALTALSLIFAVFRCNPAPICVLDEVDAPLDDANVERFCMLLEDIERETRTRFLVVTHHPMTMARMDRLYGVTMQERGVSRLLSVDLARAAAMVEQRDLALEDSMKFAAD